MGGTSDSLSGIQIPKRGPNLFGNLIQDLRPVGDEVVIRFGFLMKSDLIIRSWSSWEPHSRSRSSLGGAHVPFLLLSFLFLVLLLFRCFNFFASACGDRFSQHIWERALSWTIAMDASHASELQYFLEVRFPSSPLVVLLSEFTTSKVNHRPPPASPGKYLDS